MFTRSFDFVRFHGFFLWRFYTCTQISGFYSRIHSFPCVDHIRFRFQHSRDISQSRHFSCVSIFIHILLYRCGGRSDGGIYRFFFHVSAHACGGIGRSCILFTLIFFYYLRWYSFFPSFGRQYFAGVNWQVAKRTKVLSASM